MDWILRRSIKTDALQGCKFQPTNGKKFTMTISQDAVDASLDASQENGYIELLAQPLLDIAVDMVLYDSQFESLDPEELVPYVQSYMMRKGPNAVKTI